MKTTSKNLTLLLTLALFMTSISHAWSQPHRGMRQTQRDFNKMECLNENQPMFKSLSEDQKSKIASIRLNHQKEMIQIKNLLGEKKARLRTLQTAETPNIKEMDGLIEEIGHIKIDAAKKRNQVHQSIRELLTEEQRVTFDSRMMHKMTKMERKGKGNRMNRGACFED